MEFESCCWFRSAVTFGGSGKDEEETVKKSICMALALSMGYAHSAQASSSDQSMGWSGNVSLGYLSTTGNTHKTTATGGTDLDHKTRKWRDHIKFDAVYSRDSGETTASRYQGAVQRNFDLKGEKHYFFTRATALKDQFSGYDYVLTTSVGYGQRVWEKSLSYSKKPAFLDLEIGPGYRYARIRSESISPGDNRYERNGTIRTGAKFLFPLSATASFKQSLDGTFTVTGKRNIDAESDTALVAHVMDKLAVQISYQVNYVEFPPDGNSTTDTQTKVSLLYQI